jgi:hypothetical protein
MVQADTGRHHVSVERIGNKLKTKNCGKIEKTKDISSICP